MCLGKFSEAKPRGPRRKVAMTTQLHANSQFFGVSICVVRLANETSKCASARKARLEFYFAAFDAHRVFDFIAALGLKVFRLIPNKFLEIFQAGRAGAFARFRAGIQQLLIERFQFFVLFFGI